MGRQLDLFGGGASVDRSFASPAAMATDRVEMSLWMARELKKFDGSLGEETKACLLPSLTNGMQQQLEVQQQQPQQQPNSQQFQSGSSSPSRGPSEKRRRLQVVYIAGVEGTGHHGFMPLLLYPAVREYGGGVLAWWRSLREVLLKCPPSERRAKLNMLLEAMQTNCQDEPRILFEWCSYPFGEEHRERWADGVADTDALARELRSGNPGNSVDLREFVDIFSEFADVKVLVLHRGLISASWSHKEWDQGLLKHARILALFMEYLTGVLGGLDPDMWRWVAYEDVCNAHLQGEHAAVAAALSAFLGLPAATLQRSFSHFRPSSKDAAAEMPGETLREIRALEDRHSDRWFPSAFPGQRMLAEFDASRQPSASSAAAPTRVQADTKMDAATEQAFTKLIEALSEEQRQLWLDVHQSANATEAQRSEKVKRLQAMLSEDQMFLLKKALITQEASQKASKLDVDPTAYTCVHMWLGGCGFGSEVNNLMSAAVFCMQNGLDCIVEDDGWNSGRLHDFVNAEPCILKSCRWGSRCRPLEIRRDRRQATTGWFLICGHAKGVSFQEKSALAQKVWSYTVETERRLKELNRDLNLPGAYVAVQIRRGDKVAGSRRETLKVTISDYVRAAAAQCAAAQPSACRTVVVCSDDLGAAEEFAREMGRAHPELSVRFRARKSVPNPLVRGHWQAEFNSLSAEDRRSMTLEFLADVQVMRAAKALVCTHSSNVGRLVALLRDGPTVSLDGEWTNG